MRQQEPFPRQPSESVATHLPSPGKDGRNGWAAAVNNERKTELSPSSVFAWRSPADTARVTGWRKTPPPPPQPPELWMEAASSPRRTRRSILTDAVDALTHLLYLQAISHPQSPGTETGKLLQKLVGSWWQLVTVPWVVSAPRSGWTHCSITSMHPPPPTLPPLSLAICGKRQIKSFAPLQRCPIQPVPDGQWVFSFSRPRSCFLCRPGPSMPWRHKDDHRRLPLQSSGGRKCHRYNYKGESGASGLHPFNRGEATHGWDAMAASLSAATDISRAPDELAGRHIFPHRHACLFHLCEAFECKNTETIYRKITLKSCADLKVVRFVAARKTMKGQLAWWRWAQRFYSILPPPTRHLC